MFLKMAMILALLFVVSMAEARSSTRFLGEVVHYQATSLVCHQAIGVNSGDTCLGISEGASLSLDDFSNINPNLNCNVLFVGQWVCGSASEISAASDVRFETNPLVCTQAVAVNSGDTCFSISQGVDLSLYAFNFINPNLNCDALFVGQWVCVSGSD